jgi:hypothetical protein
MPLDAAVMVVTALVRHGIYSVARRRHGVSDMRMPKRIDALTYLPRLLRLSPAILFLAAAASSHAGSSDVRHVDASRISVTAVGGDVDFTMAGNSVTVEPDTTVLLPARIVTGHDGTVGLTQAGTNVSVASDTDVEIPAEAVDGNLIARLIQRRGNVFYDVAPRDLGKLRVETPLLVAVIKGTQFNVAVQPDSTTISLFEGRLEVRTPDSSDVVQLDAGEIAIRSVVDGAIRVVGMNDERAAAPRAARAAVAARTAPAESALGTRTTLAGDAVVARVDARDPSVTKPTIAVGAEAVAPAPLAIDARAAVGSVVLDVGLDAEVDVGRAAVDVGLGTEVDLGSTAVDVGLDTGLDVGSAAVEVGLDAAIDVGDTALDAGLDTGVNLGGGTVDANLEAGLDLGADIADAAVDTTVELGGSLDAGLDVADASPGAGVTLDVDTLDLGVDAGLDVGVLDVGLDVDLGGDTLDLGLGGADDTAPEPEPPPPPRLLGGLLGLP